MFGLFDEFRLKEEKKKISTSRFDLAGRRIETQESNGTKMSTGRVTRSLYQQ